MSITGANDVCTTTILFAMFTNAYEENVSFPILKGAVKIEKIVTQYRDLRDDNNNNNNNNGRNGSFFYMAGYIIEERRRRPVITASPQRQCSK